MESLLLVFLLVVGAAIAALGYGSILSTGLRIDPNLGDRGVVGMLCFGFLGSLLHLAVPLSDNVHLAVLAVGVVLAVMRWRQLRNTKLTWVAASVIFVYVAAHPQAILNPDTGLYHMQTLRWMTEHPIVPGLVNLHGRLAYNSMIFPMTGVVDRQGLGWVANLLIVFFVLLSLAIRLRASVDERRYGALPFWCLLLSIAALLAENQINSLGWYGVMNADIFSAVVIVYCTNVAIGMATSHKLESDLATLVLASVLACMVKLAAAPLMLPALAMAWMHRKRLTTFTAVGVASVSALVVGVWMVRSVLVSGCAVFPVSETCAYSLSWASTEASVRAESGWIKSWPRNAKGTPDEVLKDWAWLPGWLNRMGKQPVVRLLLVFAPLGVICAFLRRKIRGELGRGVCVVAFGLAACLAFWFLTAPDMRFGAGFLLSAALVGASVTLASLWEPPARWAAHAPSLILLVLSVASVRLVSDVISHHSLNPDGTLTVSAWHYFYMVPKSATYEGRVEGGRTVFVTKPEAGNLCWNHPLPCTPYFGDQEAEKMKKVKWPANLLGAPRARPNPPITASGNGLFR
jgi:hypothetical protein